MEKRIRTAVAIGAAIFALGAHASEGTQPFGMLSMDQVEKMIGLPNVVVVDANHDDLYKKNHLPGAVLLKGSLANLLPTDKGRTLVFYCASPT
jgi:rhodanese-related sulfurtransferase